MMNLQVWAFPPDGAQMPASKTSFLRISGSTGSSLKALMLLRSFRISAKSNLISFLRKAMENVVNYFYHSHHVLNGHIL